MANNQYRQGNQEPKKKSSGCGCFLAIILIVAMTYGGVKLVDWINSGVPTKPIGEIQHGLSEVVEEEEYSTKGRSERGDYIETYLHEAAKEEKTDSKGNTIIEDSIERDDENGACIYVDSDGGLNVIQYDSDQSYMVGDERSFSIASVPEIKETRGLVLFGLDDPGSSMAANCKELVKELKDQGSDCEMDDVVTVDDYRTEMSGYDYVIIRTHGYMLNYGYGFKSDPSDAVPVLCTHEDITSSNLNEYADDISQQRIAKVTVVDEDEPGGVAQRYWILPSFFEEYYGNGGLEGTYVHLGCCYGFGGNTGDAANYDDRLPLAIKDCGAEAVTGFYNSVFTSYDQAMISEIMNTLFSGKDLEEAIEKAKTVYGSDDGEFAMDMGWLDPGSSYRDSVQEKLDKGIAYIDMRGNLSFNFRSDEEYDWEQDDDIDDFDDADDTDDDIDDVDDGDDDYGSVDPASVVGYWVDLDKRAQLGDNLLWDDSLTLYDDGTGLIAEDGGALRLTYTVDEDGTIYFVEEGSIEYTGKISGDVITVEANHERSQKEFTYQGPPE